MTPGVPIKVAVLVVWSPGSKPLPDAVQRTRSQVHDCLERVMARCNAHNLTHARHSVEEALAAETPAQAEPTWTATARLSIPWRARSLLVRDARAARADHLRHAREERELDFLLHIFTNRGRALAWTMKHAPDVERQAHIDALISHATRPDCDPPLNTVRLNQALAGLLADPKNYTVVTQLLGGMLINSGEPALGEELRQLTEAVTNS